MDVSMSWSVLHVLTNEAGFLIGTIRKFVGRLGRLGLDQPKDWIGSLFKFGTRMVVGRKAGGAAP